MPSDLDIQMHPPPEAGSSSGNTKRKRAGSLDTPGSSNIKKPRNVFAPRSKKPKKPSDWHLRKGEVPKDAEKTKLALELHLRVLWGLPDQNGIPPKVTDADKAPFTRRFSSEAQVKTSVTASLDENSANIHDAQARVRQFLNSLPDGSIISNNIKRIEEAHLLFMFRTVACFGLQRWAPDVLSSDSQSMYNILHEHIALTTFEQVSSAFGYSHMGNNLAVIKDFAIMRKFYGSFVYSYMHSIAKSEAKRPGSVAKGKKMTALWKRRSNLTDGRVDVLKACGFNKRVVALARETEAHSDDELAEGNADANNAVYHITEKEGRASKVTKFFRMSDEQRVRMAQGKNRHHKSKRLRVDPDPPKLSVLTARPKYVPIDWFDPIYWNTYLTVRERANYIKDGVYVALPREEFCETWAQCAAWKNLPDQEFMEKYGNVVLEQYQLPSEGELEQLEQWEMEDKGFQESSDES